ncbi:hypothetical protein PUNSTDRAFT_54252, partial [Punctularia strigosozonata HHB-11173 SS5]|uniref:uncharacterized protein n=1 Tax=Punctularia strigosozonata (strain HHB-11173) TaxID=741275 RepID=UPI0004416477
MGDHERWQGLQEMRGDADHVRRLVAEMEDALLRTIPLVRDVLVDIERRDARRGETLEELLGYKDAAVQIDPSAEKEHSMPFVGGRRPDETRKVKREELKAFIESFQHIYAEISGEATMTYPREDLRAVTTLCQKWSEVNPSLHDCGRSVDQQARYDSDKVLRPRPRIGADEQGYPYHDWSACQPETWPFTWLQRERLVMQQLGMRFDNIAIDADIRLLPAPLCPRRPRVFARQHEIQFSDIPQTIHSALERWYRIYGRCSECIVRAMRTFPPWIIKVFKEDELVDGNPVFANTL